jgi:hypothetical protein
VAIGCAAFVLAVHAQGPGPFPGLPPDMAAMFQERQVLARFDASRDGHLDLTERQAARKWMADQPPAGLAGVIGRFGGPPGGAAAMFGGRGFAAAARGRTLTPADVRTYGREPLYETTALRTLFLEFESADWEQELADFYNSDVDVPATLRVDGQTYRDVGVRFRGMSSYAFVPEGSKRSLNLSIDFVDDDQRLLGYRTLNLLNGNGDPTWVRAPLYAEIARHYIPTLKVNYVRTVVNGESWGVYLNAQQYNSDFVREWFQTRDGARWKVPGSPFGQGGMAYLGESIDAYRGIYEIKTRDEERPWRDLIRMFRVLNETPAATLEQALSPLLDIDGALKFLALEVALVNSDGYWARASDYNIYQDQKGRFHLIPHDTNEALASEGGGPGRGGPGRGGRGGPPQLPPGIQLPPGMAFPAAFGQAGADLDPLVGLDDASKPLRSKLLAVPALRARYLGYVREIAEKWLDWRTLEPLVTQYQSVIAEEVAADTRKLYTTAAFRSAVTEGEESLKHFVDERRAFLLKTLP